MQTVPDTVATALARTHDVRVRLHLLAGIDDFTVTRTWDDDDRIITGGSVSLDRSRQVRGTSTLTLVNADGVLTPIDLGDPFAGRSLLRIERGIRAGGTVTWIPLATHVIDRPRTSMFGSLSLGLNDRLWLAQQAFGEPLTLDAGMPVATAVRALLGPVLGDDDALWVTDDDGHEIGAPVIVAEDDQRLDRAVALCTDFALELLTDRLGRVVIRPKADPMSEVSVLTLEHGRTLVGHEVEMRAQPYNRFVVIGEPLTGSVIRSVANVTDPTSPLHADRIGLIVAPPHRSADITTQFQADEVAYAGLVEAALVETEAVSELVPDPRLDEGDVVTLAEPLTASSGAFRIERIDHPVTTGGMRLTATRTRSLLA
jgi:hypothetical protein